MRAHWEELVAFVGQNFSLSDLTLTLDVLPLNIICAMEEFYESDHELKAYKMMIIPLRELGQMGLKRFYAHLGDYQAYEAEAEKVVMGEDYEAKGKVPPSRQQ
jgi:hypothetical protein